ncbi:MAG: metallophosphoesterase [bacterium]
MCITACLAGAAWGQREPQFTFAVIGDRTASPEDGEYERILAEVSQLGPDFIVTVGDHIDGYTSDSSAVERQWDDFASMMDATGIQYYLTPGNHDAWDRQSQAIFRRRFGGPDRFFRFMGKVFVILDVANFNRGDAVPREKIEWLKRVLEVSKTSGGIFVFYHKPFWCEDFSSGRTNELHEIFRSYPVKAVFTGHYHRYFHTVRDSIEYFAMSSSGGSLPGGGRARGSFYSYLLGRVRGDSFSVRLVEPGIFTPTDIVTYDDALAMARVEAGSVRLSELIAYGFDMSGTGQVTVTVDNPGEATLTDTVAWVLRGDWAVEPMRDYLEVPPGETGTLTAFVRCDGSLFPVPALEIDLPCCEGRVLEVTKPLNVKRATYAGYVDAPPRIDGFMDEDLWRKQHAETRFFGPMGGRSPADSTVLRLCYDSTRVYVGVECFDRDVGSLGAAARERDAFAAEDDAVTLLFEPPAESEVFYQVSVNPLGTVFDRRVEICPLGTYVADVAWDATVEVKARIAPDRWMVEMALPLAALSQAGLGESRWGFNFTRTQQRLGTSADFQAPFRYRSDAIGLLGFR